DIVAKRMYLTGGIGSRGTVEAFGDDYELPNLRAYTETCASIGSDLWNHRMFLLHGDGKYIDLFEPVLYTAALSAASLARNTFSYQNPLESNGRAKRTEYFEVACCPANLARLLEQLPGLVYAQTDDVVYVNLYVGSNVAVTLHAADVRLRQQTRYPWSGIVTLDVNPVRDATFTIAMRIPAWARQEP